MIAAAAYFTYGATLGAPGPAVTVAGQSMMIYGTGAYLGAAAAAGFVGGALATGSLKGALRGAFIAGLTAGVGGSEWFGGLSESAQTALDVGMAIASRSVTSHDRNVQQETAQATQIATTGGTVSSVTGGKFANGGASSSTKQIQGEKAQENHPKPIAMQGISIGIDEVALVVDQTIERASFREELTGAGGTLIDRRKRFIYTEKLGYIDLLHVVSASTAYGAKVGLTPYMGYWVEALQWSTQFIPGIPDESFFAFLPEDLRSNQIGSMAALRYAYSDSPSIGYSVEYVLRQFEPFEGTN